MDVDLRIKPLRAFLNLFTNRSYHVERFKSRRLTERLEQILDQQPFDVVQFEMLYMCPYLDAVRARSGAKVVLRAHNIEHLIWERIAATTSNPLKRLYISHLARTLKNYEVSVVNRFDGVATISEKTPSFSCSVRVPCSRHGYYIWN